MKVRYHVPLEYHRILFYLTNFYETEMKTLYKRDEIIVEVGNIPEGLWHWLETHSLGKEVVEDE